jgi:hypothetical protein
LKEEGESGGGDQQRFVIFVSCYYYSEMIKEREREFLFNYRRVGGG